MVARRESGPSNTLAAVDLGSNSFHLIVASEQDGRIQVIDKHKEMVRLAAGLRAGKTISPDATERALACLGRFAQRIRDLPSDNVRVVGTNTLRQARDGELFIARAEAILGNRIEIISGREEARLIFLGVSHFQEDDYDSRLVVDIGGGSTEIILGRQFQPQILESLHIGCVATSRTHFADGLTRDAFEAAETAALQELEVVREEFRQRGWATAIGTSGTISTVNDAIWELGRRRRISLDSLHTLRDHLIEHRFQRNYALNAVSDQRAPVFPGGLAILTAIFRSLEIDVMNVSSGALREGLLFDLIGRVHAQDIREESIRDLMQRFHVDIDHAERVAVTARTFATQLADAWSIASPDMLRLVGWAALVHEIGMDISHSQYHKHGAYLLDNMDLPGFSRQDQHDLSLIVRNHRRKVAFADKMLTTDLIRACLVVRLAVVLHRARTTAPLPKIKIAATDDAVELRFPEQWLANHPLTNLDLAQEAMYLRTVPIELKITAR